MEEERTLPLDIHVSRSEQYIKRTALPLRSRLWIDLVHPQDSLSAKTDTQYDAPARFEIINVGKNFTVRSEMEEVRLEGGWGCWVEEGVDAGEDGGECGRWWVGPSGEVHFAVVADDIIVVALSFFQC